MKFKRGTIKRFTELMKRDGWPSGRIKGQLALFKMGVRDVRLCDNCIVLLDGVVKE